MLIYLCSFTYAHLLYKIYEKKNQEVTEKTTAKNTICSTTKISVNYN